MNHENSADIIPQPRPTPLLGNIPDIDTSTPIQSLLKLQKIYGPIFRFARPGGSILVISSQELVNELSDEKRFDKVIQGALKNIRDFAGDGLFTAHTHEPNWEVAHRILVPALGPMALRDMFPSMLDIAEQLFLKWERIGDHASIDVVDNMTRLTLDTIALCAFDYRFNSFYEREMHPFVDAMVRGLEEAGARVRRLSIQTRLMLMTERQYGDDVKYMHDVADKVISERRLDPDAASKRDLLSRMLSGKDSITGKGLDDVNIRYQMVTFLIAGHETTSGLLSFAVHLLLKNPEVLAKARAEVDRVFGTETPKYEHIAQLKYVDQILKEALRLWPTAPAYSVYAREETMLGGKYPVKKNEASVVLALALHRDEKVWKNPEAFDPDRFESGAYEKLPPNAWKPFGNGQRACIGRGFAMQEATLVLGMLLQRFDIREKDPSYQLQVKETLTLKPNGLFIHAKRRNVSQARAGVLTPKSPEATEKLGSRVDQVVDAGVPSGIPLLIAYGSNSGSSEAFAQRIGVDARAQGYAPRVCCLDDCLENIANAGAAIIVSASYEGHAPDNARNFIGWLNTVQGKALGALKYAVFGCGNKDWARTYQAIPKKIDDLMAAAGASRIKGRGEADARGDFFGDFERWYESLWTDLAKALGVEVREASERGISGLYEVEEVSGEQEASALSQNGLKMGQIVENRELVNMSAPGARSKRHVEIALPEGQTYQSGDYLAILPENPPMKVDQALRRFGFSWESQIVIRTKSTMASSLPIGRPVSVREILARYVELSLPATQKQIALLAASSPCPPERKALEAFESYDLFKGEILEKRVSVLDLLERYASCALTIGQFLEMVPPLKPRQYSISSTPVWNEKHCTITVAIVEAPAISGQGHYLGVCSSYLAAKKVGAQIAVATRASKGAFHLPSSLEIPVIMVGAGTGFAPFRGFIQERALRAAGGEKLGPALLYFGCDHPDVDFLYRDELTAWQQQGVVNVRPTFFNKPDGDIQFVQHRIWQEREEIMTLLDQGAHIYVCGDGRRMAPAVRDAFVRIYREIRKTTDQEAADWVQKLEEGIRYVADVFS